MKIILSGGGTGGPVTPLLAITEKLKSSNKNIDFLWLGTKKGMEQKMVKNANLKFQAIYSGKFRRYFSFKNIIDLFFIKLGFFQSLWKIFKFKPDIILTAGGFVAVPVVWAGWFLRIPILAHQQDVKVGLANKLMAPFATIITCSLEKSVNDFNKKKKVYFTGNAIRDKIINTKIIKSETNAPLLTKEGVDKAPPLYKGGQGGVLNFKNNLPTILILGGGTGSKAVNTIIVQALPKFANFCNVIHITGENKKNHCSENPNYHQFQFLPNIEEAFASADLVITRAGMGVLSELSILGKPTIIIPIPDSHQELNANYFADRKSAIVLAQKKLTSEILSDNIKKILSDENKQKELSKNIKNIMPADGAHKIADIILKEIK
ncbi:undecaprenyldiphospho-muramoylpentapeptide beta-N-acetylglucosaminyltransferase [Patescibacteria group bacterium]